MNTPAIYTVYLKRRAERELRNLPQSIRTRVDVRVQQLANNPRPPGVVKLFRRRELHRQNPQKGGERPRYGGTTCDGFVKNTLVKHVKHGLTRISGFGKTGISLYSLAGKRLCQNAKTQDFKVLTRLNFNYRSGISSPP